MNNIAPGYVETEILVEDEELLNTWKSEMLMDELARPDDIAPLAVYLSSDASSYVTGETVIIDGGYTVR
nr:SDR family oxidoreductase [Halovivax sp.]